jgi:hypothetical protein
LRLLRLGIRCVNDPVCNHSRGKAGHCRSRANADIAAHDVGRAGIRDSGRPEDFEAVGCAKPYRRLHRAHRARTVGIGKDKGKSEKPTEGEQYRLS